MISTLSPPTVDDHAVDDTSENAAGEQHPVEVFGIRHHGPGSARSLVAALRDYQPDALLIEGPADADPLLRWVLADEMTPPLALLGYAPDHPQTAAFWPYAVFSPEWPRLNSQEKGGFSSSCSAFMPTILLLTFNNMSRGMCCRSRPSRNRMRPTTS